MARAMWWEQVHAAKPDGSIAGRSNGCGDGVICGPKTRWGHTCNAVGGGRYLYVFGGYGGDKCQTNDVHVFDTVKHTWSKPILRGAPPSPRDSHSCTTVGNKLFVFGGTDGKKPLKDLHILDTSCNTWIAPDIQGEGPESREGHSTVLVDKRLFIFGGCGKSETHEEKYYNDLYIMDTEKSTWERAVTTGIPPSARDSHSCSSWKNKIIVIAGEDSSDCYLSDVYVLDADTLVWEPMKTAGQMLPPRAGHTTVGHGSSLYVFGGFTDARSLYGDLHVLDADTGIWSRVRTVNQGPSPRFSVAADCMDERKGILIFIGGCNQTLEALDDMYYLHTGVKLCDSECVGKIIFEAKITSTSSYGYAIETIINGKRLHGMLVAGTSSSRQDDHTYPNKKMAVASANSKGSRDQPIPKTSTTILGTICSNQEQTNGSDVKESTAGIPSLETPTTETKALCNVEQSSVADGVCASDKISDGQEEPNDTKQCEHLSATSTAAHIVKLRL